jgi:MFS family permease
MNARAFFPRLLRVLAVYWERLGAFHPNARLYLASVILTGAAIGVYRLLFNFYILSQGYDETILGLLVTTSSLTALLVALPMGYLADRLGRKFSLILGSLATAAGVAVIVLFPSVTVFISANILMGFGQSLAGVSMGPFLMENSGEKERTYLFSFSSGLQMASAFVGNWIGGYLPTWLGGLQGAAPTSTQAYGASLLVTSAAAVLAVLPLVFLRKQRGSEPLARFSSLGEIKQQSGMFSRLILPMLITSIGAGMFMPFMNVFFRQVHHLPDPVIGSLFAWGSLAMGLGLLIAPPLADRFGKIQLIVFTQAISLPFLAALGFSPWFTIGAGAYYVRLALMNMSGPVYQTFVMEQVGPKYRATVASLASMANSFGWAFSPSISGWIQVRYGFGPAFAITLLLYALSTFFYWRFFWPRPARHRPREAVLQPGVE